MENLTKLKGLWTLISCLILIVLWFFTNSFWSSMLGIGEYSYLSKDGSGVCAKILLTSLIVVLTVIYYFVDDEDLGLTLVINYLILSIFVWIFFYFTDTWSFSIAIQDYDTLKPIITGYSGYGLKFIVSILIYAAGLGIFYFIRKVRRNP